MNAVVQLSPSAVGIDPGFMRRTAPELARDIVCQLDTAANLAAGRGLTPNQWLVLKVWPAFVQMVKDANEELGGSAGTGERARRKAALAISEVGVQDMAGIMGDLRASPRDRIAAFDQLKDVAGLNGKQVAAGAGAQGAPAAGPLINIVLPGGVQVSVGETTVVPSASNIVLDVPPALGEHRE